MTDSTIIASVSATLRALDTALSATAFGPLADKIDAFISSVAQDEANYESQIAAPATDSTAAQLLAAQNSLTALQAQFDTLTASSAAQAQSLSDSTTANTAFQNEIAKLKADIATLNTDVT